MRYLPVMIDPWKSALTNFACIPADDGISFGEGVPEAGGAARPNSSDIYPSHRRCRGMNNSHL